MIERRPNACKDFHASGMFMPTHGLTIGANLPRQVAASGEGRRDRTGERRGCNRRLPSDTGAIVIGTDMSTGAGDERALRRSWRSLAAACLLAVSVVALAGAPAMAAAGPNGCDQAGASPFDRPRLSGDGSRVVFTTSAALVQADTNRTLDVYLSDGAAGGGVQLVSVAADGAAGDARSSAPDISVDGRYVAFESDATNLVDGDDPSGVTDVFIHDTATGSTELVSVSRDHSTRDGASSSPAISPDGRFVAFESVASNLIDSDNNSASDIFVRDRMSAVTQRASIGPDGSEGRRGSHHAAISDTGLVAFHSTAPWAEPNDDPMRSELKNTAFYDRNVFVHDLHSGATSLVSVALDGGTPNGLSLSPAITPDGRYVSFLSSANDLVDGDTNNAPDLKGFYQSDVFVRDLETGTTSRVSVDDGGGEIDGRSLGGSISNDGRRVAFETADGDVGGGDANGVTDVYVHDVTDQSTGRLSAGAGEGGTAAADPLSFGSLSPSISGDAQHVAFVSSSRPLLGSAVARDKTPYVFGVFITSVVDGNVVGPLGVGCRTQPDVAGERPQTDGTAGASAVDRAAGLVPGPEAPDAPVVLVLGGLLLAAAAVTASRRRSMSVPALVAVTTFVAAVSVPVPPAAAHHYSPIQPGAALLEETPSGTASLNFIFRDETSGDLYVGTAAHAVREFSVGSRMSNDALGEYGTLVYAREGIFDFSKQDFALIKIDADKHELVDPAVRHFGGPTAVAATRQLVTGAPTHQYGQASFMRNSEGTRSKQGVFQKTLDNDIGLAGWFLESRHGYGGDSGSPVLYGSDGQALGVDIGFAVLFSEPGVSAGPTVELILQELQLAGFDVELVTAPFHGLAGDAVGRASHCAQRPVEEGPQNDGCVRPSAGG